MSLSIVIIVVTKMHWLQWYGVIPLQCRDYAAGVVHIIWKVFQWAESAHWSTKLHWCRSVFTSCRKL